MGSPVVRDAIRFLLNDKPVELSGFAPDLTLLDYLRLEQRLVGTKEGCAEGDCGACTVLIGRLSSGKLVYESVTSCIRFIGTLDGCHIVTIEHLRRPDGTLHPVQKAMVERHGSQCGFCTPGIVMSLYGLWMHNSEPTRDDINTALQGNLCRCTGYRPIIAAALAAAADGKQSQDPLVAERETVITKLQAFSDGARVEISSEKGQFFIPASLDDFADLYASMPGATLVNGSTDVGLWATKFLRDMEPVIYLGGLDDLHKVAISDKAMSIGSALTYSEFLPLLDRFLPQLSEYWLRIGGQQVRNMGTIGGNIANGSPIGDTPPVLIALGAGMTLRKGSVRRFVLLEDFFIDYGKQDREPGEFIEIITIPFPDAENQFGAYKISKRKDEDISSVAVSINLALDRNVVKDIRIAFGGMAATPKRAEKTEAALLGEAYTEAAILGAQGALTQDFSPISDMRAGADYRLLVAQNLLMRFFIDHQITEREDASA